MKRRGHQSTGPRPRPRDKPKVAPFDAEATRDNIKSILERSEIAYLVQSFIDKGKNFDKLKQDSKFTEIWSKIESEDGVTLPRICNAFPEVACEYLQRCPTRPISLEACIKASGCPEFPAIARHSSCATLIPENFNFRAEALEVIMMANMMFSEKIQTPDIAELSPKEKLHHNFEFVKKSFHSPVLLEGDRWELSTQFGIVAEDGSLSEPWMAAADAAGRWLKNTYNFNIRIHVITEDVHLTER